MNETPNLKTPAVPPPPEPEIAIRTMESDLQSLEQSGGQSLTPEVLKIKTAESEAAGETRKRLSPKWKLTIIILGALLIAFLLWLFGYFVIFPWLFPKSIPPSP